MKIPMTASNQAVPPVYAHEHDSGADIRAVNDGIIYPGECKKFPTGLRAAVPPGYEMQLRSRSGLALKGIVVANAPATIDAGFRGEIGVILANLGNSPYAIITGDRIAQAVICPVVRATFVQVMELDDTERGEGGFGSSGV